MWNSKILLSLELECAKSIIVYAIHPSLVWIMGKSTSIMKKSNDYNSIIISHK